MKKKKLTDEQKLYYFMKGLQKGIMPLISLHNPEDIETLVGLIQKYEGAEDIEEEFEREKKYRRKRNTKKKKVVFESDSSEDDTYVKKNNKKKEKEPEEDPIEKLTKQMENLTLNLARTNKPKSLITCYNCGKMGHVKRDCRSSSQQNNNNQNRYQNNNYNPNRRIEYRNSDRRNNNQTENSNNQRNKFNKNNIPANFVSTENESEYETDSESEEVLALLNEKYDSFGNLKGTKRKEPAEPELIYDYRTDPKRNKKMNNNQKQRPIPMDWTTNKKDRKKTSEKLHLERKQPSLLQVPDFDIVKKLKEQKIEITIPQLLKISNSEKKKLRDALKTPKETNARLADSRESPKTTTLECKVVINGFKVPATIDSGAATSIIARNTMEQLGFDIEESTNRNIISANGSTTASLGKIIDLPIVIEEENIPITVEVMETEAYNILLGNDWLKKAGASYDWKNQELTINWRNQKIKTTASYEQTDNHEDEEDDDYSSEEEQQILFQGNH